ncbi:hypothetical protein [Parabacteroides gordonii]|uniref:hypothetical protein n=1 Tax=Parabacteroides gordonii TaxID=574930 RepID=UPI0026ECB4B7|nr:hypothetical protein [Parabacteroides gordonii]
MAIAMKSAICQYINRKFTSFLLISFLFFCFFPYLRILPLNVDKQPNALILSFLIVVFLGRKKVVKDVAWLLFVLTIATICMFFSWEDWLVLQIWTNYASLFFIAYASYIALNYLGGIPYALFKWCIYIWFIVGAIQYFIYPSFMDFILYRSDNEWMLESGRGVTSLAVEPTNYGICCLFLQIINYLNFRNQSAYKLLTQLLLVQIFLFSLSSTCFFCMVVSAFSYMLYKICMSKHRFKWLFLLIIVSYIVYNILLYLLENIDIRFTKLLNYLLEDPTVFFINHGNHRFGVSFFSLKGFFDNWGMPHGLGFFNKYVEQVIKNPTYAPLIGPMVLAERKTFTALGGALFELGVFAFPIYYVIVSAFKKISFWMLRADFYLFLLIALMLNTTNFNNAILSFIVGNLIYLKRSSFVIIANTKIIL